MEWWRLEVSVRKLHNIFSSYFEPALSATKLKFVFIDESCTCTRTHQTIQFSYSMKCTITWTHSFEVQMSLKMNYFLLFVLSIHLFLNSKTSRMNRDFRKQNTKYKLFDRLHRASLYSSLQMRVNGLKMVMDKNKREEERIKKEKKRKEIRTKMMNQIEWSQHWPRATDNRQPNPNPTKLTVDYVRSKIKHQICCSTRLIFNVRQSTRSIGAMREREKEKEEKGKSII